MPFNSGGPPLSNPYAKKQFKARGEIRAEHGDGFPHLSSTTGACMCQCPSCFGDNGCKCASCSGANHLGCKKATLQIVWKKRETNVAKTRGQRANGAKATATSGV